MFKVVPLNYQVDVSSLIFPAGNVMFRRTVSQFVTGTTLPTYLTRAQFHQSI